MPPPDKVVLAAAGGDKAPNEHELEDVICEHSDVDILDTRNPYAQIVYKASNGNSIKYAVSFMPVPSLVANTFMYRRNEDVYKAALDTPFALDLFPAKLKEGVRYQPAYSQLSRYITAYRIRRLVLLQEIDSFGELTKDLLNLQAICQEKKTALGDRILTLEHELGSLAAVDPSSPTSRFNALLINSHGWKTINFFFHRELRRIQNKLADGAISGGDGNNINNNNNVNEPVAEPSTSRIEANNNVQPGTNLVELGEEVDESMTIEILQRCWNVLQFWRVVRCVEAMCRLGPDRYPHKKTDNENLKGLNSIPVEAVSRSRDTEPGGGLVIGKMHHSSEEYSDNPDRLALQSLFVDVPHSQDNVRISPLTLTADTAGRPLPSVKHADTNSSLFKLAPPSLSQDGADNEHSGVSPSERPSRPENPSTFRSRLTNLNLDVFSPLTNALTSTGIAGKSDRRHASSDAEISVSGHWFKQPSTGTSVNLPHRQSSHHSHHSHHSHRSVHHAASTRAEVKLVHQFKSDQVIADWKDVCTLLKTENPGIISAAKVIQDSLFSEFPDASTSLDKATLANLKFGISDAAGDELMSDFLASSMSSICDYLADILERELLHALRMMPGWLIMLEELRRDRVKSSGGKLLVKEKLEIEIDASGKRKTYPIPDVYVDTDILHNILQRLHFQVVAPAVEAKLAKLKEQRAALKGELSCLIQFAYVVAAPFLQRNIRRVQVQRKYAARLRLLCYSAMHAAVATIQSIARMRKTRKWYLALRASTELALRHAAAVQIQRVSRGHLQYFKYMAYLRHKRSMSDWYAITKYQAMIRGFIARHRHKKLMDANAEARTHAIRVWGITKIQKIVRGFLARRVLVPSLRLRKTLSPEMLRLVEKYLQQGNLWQFLRELDAENGRLRKQLAETENRENELATTFLNKVLARRANEFDSSWSMFSEAVDAHAAGVGSTGPAAKIKDHTSTSLLLESNSIGLQLEQQDGKLTAMGKPSTAVINASLSSYDQVLPRTAGFDCPAYSLTSSFPSRPANVSPPRQPFQHERLYEVEMGENATHSNLPEDSHIFKPMASSPPRSRAFSTSSAGVGVSTPVHSPGRTADTRATARSRHRSRTKSSHPQDAAQPTKPPPGALLRRAITSTVQAGVDQEMDKLKNSSSKTAQLASEIRQVYGPTLVQSASGPQPTQLPKQSQRRRQRELEPNRGQMSASTTDWLTNAAVQARETGTDACLLPPLGTQSHGRLTGTSSPSKRVKTAIKRPASQVNADQPSAHGVSDNGRKGPSIQELGHSLLLDVPRGLEDTWERLLRAASVRCYVPTFFQSTAANSNADEAFKIYQSLPSGLAKMRYEQEAWAWAAGTVHKLYAKGLVYVKDALPLSKCVMFLKSCDCPATLLDKCVECINILTQIGVPLSLGYTHKETVAQAEMISSNQLPVKEEMQLIHEELRERAASQLRDEVNAAQREAEQSMDPTIGARLLVNMVEEGPWLSLTAPIDELIMHAAYLCVPFVSFLNQAEGTTAATDETCLGQEQFTAHVQELQFLDPVQQRDSIRRRYRSALLLSTPLVLSLKAREIRVVRDLLTVSIASLTEVPEALKAQIEALLSVVVSVAANAKIVPTHRNYLTQAKDLFTIPTMFDPKFQRSPWDPYGRPARLGNMLKLSTSPSKSPHRYHHQHQQSDNDGREKNTMDYQVLPGGLWEIREDEHELGDFDPYVDEEATRANKTHNNLNSSSIEDRMWHFNASTISSASGVPAQIETRQPVTTGRIHTNKIEEDKDKDKNNRKHNNRERESSWNKRDYAVIKAQKQQEEEYNQMCPLNPRHLQPLVHLGMRGPENKLLPHLVPVSAMEKAVLHQDTQSRKKRNMLAATDQSISTSAGSRRSAKPHTSLTMKLTPAELAATDRMHAYNKDIMLRMQDDFVRPYRCSYPHCGQSFSRLYTLRVHEKSHIVFPEYHKYKKELKLFLDDDVHAVAQEREAEINVRASISQPILRELEELQRHATSRASSATTMAGEYNTIEAPRNINDSRHMLMSRSVEFPVSRGQRHGNDISLSSSDARGVNADIDVHRAGLGTAIRGRRPFLGSSSNSRKERSVDAETSVPVSVTDMMQANSVDTKTIDPMQNPESQTQTQEANERAKFFEAGYLAELGMSSLDYRSSIEATGTDDVDAMGEQFFMFS